MSKQQITLELERGWKLIYLERFWDNVDRHNIVYHSPLIHPIHFSFNDFLMSDVTHDEVLIAIRSLKCGTSAGFSDILPETIRASGISCLDTLVAVFNDWVANGYIPDKAQILRITLVHKRVERT